MTARHPCSCVRRTDCSVSVRVPTWLSLIRTALLDSRSMPQAACKQGPPFPVVLVQAVLDGHNGETGHELGVVPDHLLGRACLPSLAEFVASVSVKGRRGRV